MTTLRPATSGQRDWSARTTKTTGDDDDVAMSTEVTFCGFDQQDDLSRAQNHWNLYVW